MSRTLWYKILFIVAVAGISLFQIYPPEDQIKLGLDLRGGLHLVLEVQVAEAVAAEIRDDSDSFRRLLEDEEGVLVEDVTVDEGRSFTVVLPTDAALETAEGVAEEYFSVYGSSTASAPPSITLMMSSAQQADIEDRAVRQALQTVRNRIDAYGVAEPVIQRQGLSGDRILIQLPGIEDQERVRGLLQTTAQLRLHLVTAGPAESREELLASTGGELPPDQRLFETVPEESQDEHGTHAHFYLVEADPVVTGSDLKTARLGQDTLGLPAVSFTLNAEGSPKFGRATAENVGRQLAIVLDERIFSAPVIESQISDSGIIRGDFTIQEAEDLALVLRAGALPASMEELEQRFVGPSLGRESINRGVIAAVVGLALVVAFMLVYYKGAGINAVVALALNLVIVLGIMASLGASLTLPGIAGLILLIGMAVDANVLIFERIREEMKIGKTVRASIDAGFDKAFSAILDANLTTLIAAVFLFQFGTGPVKGFAVTLTIGILASMFTALFVSRVMFEIWTRRRHATLSI